MKVGIRKSNLALAQAKMIKELMESKFKDETVEIVGFTMEGNEEEAVFKLQQALLKGHMDVILGDAAYFPVQFEDGIDVLATLRREDASNVLITNGCLPEELPSGSVIGVNSQLLAMELGQWRRDLKAEIALREGTETLMMRMHSGDFDAVIVPKADLNWMGIRLVHCYSMDRNLFLPSPCQGILLVAGRKGNFINARLREMNHIDTMRDMKCERAFKAVLKEKYDGLIGAKSTILDNNLSLRAVVWKDGKSYFDEIFGDKEEAKILGEILGKRMLANIK